MIPNIVLSILAALFTIAAIANSCASSRYARQAKASAERASAAAARAEAARARSKAAREQASDLSKEPTRLTHEQLLPLAGAIRRRETAAYSDLLPPWPACPTCGQAPTELLVRNDHPAQFLEDRVAFGFRPCGHNFTAAAEDLYRATEQP